MSDPRPIGVFDSGVGGLTVARAIIDLLPHEPLIYVGDSARFPYGPQPVERDPAVRARDRRATWCDRDVKMLVVACNSVEVSAIGDIAVRAGIPVVGVIDPGSRAAVRATRNGVVGLIGTEATIATRRLPARAIGSARRRCTRPPARSSSSTSSGATPPATSCGRRARVSCAVDGGGIDTLILGCTHYPLLSGLLQLELGPDVVLVSSAEETAKDVYGDARVSGTCSRRADGCPCTSSCRPGDPERFQRLAEVFLGPELREVRAADAQVPSEAARGADGPRVAAGPGRAPAGRRCGYLRQPRRATTCGSTRAPGPSRGCSSRRGGRRRRDADHPRPPRPLRRHHPARSTRATTAGSADPASRSARPAGSPTSRRRSSPRTART